MELKNREGFTLINVEVWGEIEPIVLEIRKSIIVYNKTHNENLLNKTCRLCNTFLEKSGALKP